MFGTRLWAMNRWFIAGLIFAAALAALAVTGRLWAPPLGCLWLDSDSAGTVVANVVQPLLGAAALVVALASFLRARRPPNGETSEETVAAGRDIYQVRDSNVFLGDRSPTPPATVPQPIAAPTSALHQLPSPPADFTGRDAELDDLMRKIEGGGVAISGVRGMGGIGKTALALKLAERLAGRYHAAQLYVDLKGTSPQPVPVADAMAHVVRSLNPGARVPESESELAALYRSVLHGKQALLLMDNAASAEQVEPLIPSAGCLLLVTSRQRFALPGLYPMDLDTLPPEKARELLLTIEPRIGEHAGAIGELCGYLPLALRQAAGALAEHRDLAPEEYVRRLRDSTASLDEVEASLALSYNLLDESTRGLWRALAVFPGTFDPPAAAAVWEIELDAARDALGGLVASSLVEWDEGARRYRLHDLARVLADSRLSGDQRGATQRLHAAHYMLVLRRAGELYLAGGDDLARGLGLFDLEWANVQAGQAWAGDHAEKDADAARLCSGYAGAGPLLGLRQHPRQRVEWLEAALDSARLSKDLPAQGGHLGNLGLAYAALGETRPAIELYEQDLAIAREIGDRRGEGAVLGNLGVAYAALGETRRAIQLYEQRLAIAREIDDRRGEGTVMGNLGVAYAALGETHRAIELYDQAREIHRELGDRRAEGHQLGNLGSTHLELGETRPPIDLYNQRLEIAREIGDRLGEGADLSGNLGIAYVRLGEFRQATDLYEQHLAIARERRPPRRGHRAVELGPGA